MPRLQLTLAAGAAALPLLLAAPADAQQADPHAGHTLPSPAPKPAPKPTPPASDPHAGHAMPATKPPTSPDPHAGHVMPEKPPTPVPDPHAGHATPSGPAGTDLPAGNAPPPPVPADHAADAIYGAAPMAKGRHHLDKFHGGQKLWQVTVDLAEVQVQRGRDGFEWDASGWYGGDLDRLWVKTEGDGAFGRPLERVEVQALWSRAIDPYFNLQAGVRHDFRPDPSRTYAVLGIEGLAPSFFDVEAALFLSSKGELMARAEGHYDQRITQRLILQPRAELNFAAQDSRRLNLGSGLSDAEVGVRLRYDIRREFAPYLGVQYRRAFGDTRRFLRADGENLGGWSLVAGVRTWF